MRGRIEVTKAERDISVARRQKSARGPGWRAVHGMRGIRIRARRRYAFPLTLQPVV